MMSGCEWSNLDAVGQTLVGALTVIGDERLETDANIWMAHLVFFSAVCAPSVFSHVAHFVEIGADARSLRHPSRTKLLTETVGLRSSFKMQRMVLRTRDQLPS